MVELYWEVYYAIMQHLGPNVVELGQTCRSAFRALNEYKKRNCVYKFEYYESGNSWRIIFKILNLKYYINIWSDSMPRDELPKCELGEFYRNYNLWKFNAGVYENGVITYFTSRGFSMCKSHSKVYHEYLGMMMSKKNLEAKFKSKYMMEFEKTEIGKCLIKEDKKLFVTLDDYII